MGHPEDQIQNQVRGERVGRPPLKVDCQFTEADVGKFIARAIPAGLIVYQGHMIWIKPDLKPALEFVFSSGYPQKPKD